MLNTGTCSILKTLAAVAVVAFAAGPALALTSVDHDSLGLSDLGLVAAGSSLEYQHVFDPAADDTIDISSIDAAWLHVGIVDDMACDTLDACAGFDTDVAAIDLSSVSWSLGRARVTILWGDITAHADLLATNGVLDVVISNSAPSGALAVLWSNLTTTYTYELSDSTGSGAGGASPMPEPSAALVFAIGALVMRGSIRRGSQRR